MSFLIDGPWLYGTGRVYARTGERTAAVLGAATVAGFWAVSHERAGPRTHAIAAALFAAYPLCLWLGYKHGRR